jgi:hypothetical protein
VPGDIAHVDAVIQAFKVDGELEFHGSPFWLPVLVRSHLPGVNRCGKRGCQKSDIIAGNSPGVSPAR